MTEDRIIKTAYSDVMQKSYLDYAMSVIVARALPDVRDGLKPVQRRILYDMMELGTRYNQPYRKSARIVGDTMGKYHPHGDSSIYGALVVMSQDFKCGQPLVDGHGNFGNIEGDGAAAMRYTEARLQKVAQECILSDLDKNVVDFMPNFDETEKEPMVLPAKFPNILVNGSEGIAVGMATSIPPHNLAEVIDATKAYIKDPEISNARLFKHIKGPDFPTGGIIINESELPEIYNTGSGKVKIRGKVEVEEQKGGKLLVVITEIPYTMIGAGISKFLQDVAALAENHVTTDIVDISNQSSKEGIRIVIEVKKGTDIENFKNMLYKKTRLEDTFGVNMLAIANGRPETMGLRDVIRHNVDFQFACATRKYTTLLNKEREKKEVQEGLIKACNVIDLIVEILRGSKDKAMAKACLVEGKVEGIQFKSSESKIMAQMLKFTERQADAILELRLYRLIGLEIEALKKEYAETTANIFRYEDILDRRDSMAQVLINELEAMKKEYGRKRRTQIEEGAEAVFEEKKMEETDVVVLVDRFGYARCIDLPTFERNKDAAISENKYIVNCKNTGKICVFTDIGMLYTIKIKDLPFGKFRDKGVPIDNLSDFDTTKEQMISIISQSSLNLFRIMFVTKFSNCKIVSGGEFDVTRKSVAATKLEEGDSLVSVNALTDLSKMVLETKDGYFLKMDISEIPDKKKTAVGVTGMKLGVKDEIVAVHYISEFEESDVLVVHDGKSMNITKLKTAARNGKGTKVK